MPSWNIHTAHVERLLSDHRPQDLGIDDVNVFLFGNYVPDIYLGFMVADTTYRIDYCLTHVARPDLIPVPDADRFWNENVYRRRPKNATGVSLVIGAWAHLATDRFYNGRFRAYQRAHGLQADDELRIAKQGDFDLFGRSLQISNHVQITEELLNAARAFRPYSVLPDDVTRAVDVANRIVDADEKPSDNAEYQLLDAVWLGETFEACDARLAAWLTAWQKLECDGERATAESIRAEAGIPAAFPDDSAMIGCIHG